MRALVDRRATNKITQRNNRLREFALPVMDNGDLYVYRNFVVSGNEEIRGNSTIDGNLLVKGDAEVDGDLLVKGDAEVDGDLLVKGDEEVDGNLLVKGNEQINGNVNANGYILAKTFLPGQVISISMFNNTQLSQIAKSISKGVTDTIFTFNFTPKYANSYLIIEYQTAYELNGWGGDRAVAYLNVVYNGVGTRINYTSQKWVAAGGGGTRSGVLFPLTGRYTNTNTSSKAIRVDVYNNTDNDGVSVISDESTWLKIIEVGR
jgi:hypothetical protein